VKILKGIAMDIRNSDEFRQVFVEDPQILGVDAMKGSEVIFPVVFKTQATKQYGPMREFRRRVRLALEENNMLPGDPNRIFSTFVESSRRGKPIEEEEHPPDPTTLKPHDGSLFSSD